MKWLYNVHNYHKKKMLNKAETSLEVDFKTPLSLLSLLKFSKELLLFFVCYLQDVE